MYRENKTQSVRKILYIIEWVFRWIVSKTFVCFTGTHMVMCLNIDFFIWQALQYRIISEAVFGSRRLSQLMKPLDCSHPMFVPLDEQQFHRPTKSIVVFLFVFFFASKPFDQRFRRIIATRQSTYESARRSVHISLVRHTEIRYIHTIQQVTNAW